MRRRPPQASALRLLRFAAVGLPFAHGISPGSLRGAPKAHSADGVSALQRDSALAGTSVSLPAFEDRLSNAESFAATERSVIQAQQETLKALEAYEERLVAEQANATAEDGSLASDVDRGARRSAWWWSAGVYVAIGCLVVWCLCCIDVCFSWRRLQARTDVPAGPLQNPMAVLTEAAARMPAQQANAPTANAGQHTQQAQRNRELFEEEQRRVSRELLMRALPLLGAIAVLFFVVGLCAFIIYVWGWLVWIRHHDEPCDQALSTWVLAMLIAAMIPAVSDSSRAILSTVKLILTLVGVWMYFSSETCSKTNPEMYRFVQWYFIFLLAEWVLQSFVLFGFASLALWMVSQGLTEQDPARAGRKGLIEEIETVPYSPDLFENQAPECCICQENFGPDKPIKRTPCNHLFHEECLGDWLGKFAKSCPLCRRNLDEALAEPPPVAQRTPSGPASTSGAMDTEPPPNATVTEPPQVAQRTPSGPASNSGAADTELPPNATVTEPPQVARRTPSEPASANGAPDTEPPPSGMDA